MKRILSIVMLFAMVFMLVIPMHATEIEEPQEPEDNNEELGFLERIAKGIEDIADTVINGIKDILENLFVPDEEFVNAKIEALAERFGFAWQITEVVENFKDKLQELAELESMAEPPKIYINLDDSESKYDFGGRVEILDFTFYQPYREQVHGIISAIIWVMWLWRMFIKLPSIIHGEGGNTSSNNDTQNGKEITK